MTKARWIGLGVGVFMILAMVGVIAWQGSAILNTAGTVLAQTGTTPTPTPGANNNSTIGDTFWNLLAQKLGISADTLKADAVQVRKDMLDQAVKDGKLTQAQADALKAKLDSNGLILPIRLPRGNGQTKPFTAPQGKRGVPPTFAFKPFIADADVLEAIAGALKMSPSDLVTQMSSGKTLADIATAQGVDQSAVKQAIINAETARIDRAVNDGLLTQTQADKLKANLTPDKIDLSKVYRGFHFQR